VVEIDGKPVELATANAYAQLQSAAAKDGVYINVVSGFRSQGEQQHLYGCYVNCNCNNCNLAAYPGYSNHQSGLALDLNTTAPGVLHWLNRNGSRFGFVRTVPSEDWHWEYVGGVQGGPCNANGRSRSTALKLRGFSDGEYYRNGQWVKVDSEDDRLHHVEYHIDGYLMGVSENRGDQFPMRLVLNTLGERTIQAIGYDTLHRKIGESEVTVTFIEGETATESLKFSGVRPAGWYRNGLFLKLDNAPRGTKTVEYGVGAYPLGSSAHGTDNFPFKVRLGRLGYRAFHARALAADGRVLASGSVLIRILPGIDDTTDASIQILSPEPEDSRPQTVDIRIAASDSVARLRLYADEWYIGEAELTDGLWRHTYHFNEGGERKLRASAQDANGRVIAEQSLTFTVR